MATPKKSIQELKAAGTYRPSRHGSDEDHPVVRIERPVTPHFVNESALRYFEDIVGICLDMDIVGKADSLIIGLLSNEIEEWVLLNQMVKAEGFMVKMPTATGFMQDVINPKIKVREDKLKTILKMMGELGLSPAARSKVQVNEKNKEEQSALGQFLAASKK